MVMDLIREKLKERCLLFLYVLSASKSSINVNTFRRYIYLYYLSGKFFDDQMDDIKIYIDKGDISILYLEDVLGDFEADDLIDMQKNEIRVNQELISITEDILEREKHTHGKFFDLYNSIKPFVNLLNSYDDQFIFTIFFSEPTFLEAIERGMSEMKSSNSRLTILLDEFKKQVKNSQIDNYDILTHWMDYVLKNYYK